MFRHFSGRTTISSVQNICGLWSKHLIKWFARSFHFFPRYLPNYILAVYPFSSSVMIRFRKDSISWRFNSVSQMLSRSILFFTLNSWGTQTRSSFFCTQPFASGLKWFDDGRLIRWLYRDYVIRRCSIFRQFRRFYRSLTDQTGAHLWHHRNLQNETNHLYAANFKTAPSPWTTLNFHEPLIRCHLRRNLSLFWFIFELE